MDCAVAIVIEGKVQPLAILAHKTIGIVHASFGTIHGFGLEDPLVRPGFHSVKADPQSHGAAVLAVWIVENRDSITTEIIEGSLAAGVRNVCQAGELRPSLAAVFGLRLIQHAAEPVGTDDHRDAPIGMFKEIVLCPSEVAAVRCEPDIAMFSPCLAAIFTDQDTVAWICEIPIQWSLLLLIVWADVVLEWHHDAAVFADDVFAHKGALFEPAWDLRGLAPGLERIVTGEKPGSPVVGPMLGVSGEKQRAVATQNHEFGRSLTDCFSFTRESDIEALQGSPGLAHVVAAGDASVVEWARFRVSTS